MENENRFGSEARIQVSPGGFWRRLVAYLVDVFVVSIIMSPVYFLTLAPIMAEITVSSAQGVPPELSPETLMYLPFVYLLPFLLFFLYSGFMLNRKGATLGRMVMGLKVVRENGSNLGFFRAGFRDTLGRFISSILLYIGFVMVAFRGDKKALHDIIFGSAVIKTK